ncbi:MAG TPA: aldo/keto reductase, partial [Chloroflexota bacterium]|nr:aldo/keto reductase [Chloroflexota bacterium]
MELRPLGKTGLKVSALGFGCGDVGGLMVRGDPAEQRRTVQRALDAGINFFDTSDSYGRGRSEEVLGEVLRELHAEPLVATKVTRSDHELADGGATIRANLEG